MFRESFIAEMPFREGANAIYIERPMIAYVRVSHVRCLEDRMEAQITVTPTPGMTEVGRPSYTVGAAWKNFSNIHGTWHVPYVAFTVYFGEEEVRTGLELAARAAKEGRQVTLREMRTALENCQRKYWERPPS